MPRNATRNDGIFICYRRSDTQGYAGRLEDSLKDYFGEGRVFRDVGGITPGEDFQHKIEETLERTAALVVLIGPGWLAVEEGDSPRLFNPDDTVTTEIATALKEKRQIIPVLVQGATMPRAGEVPASIALLARRNAMAVTDEDWNRDVTRLARVLSFEVTGSVAQRRVGMLKAGVLSLLAIPMVVTLVTFVSIPIAPTANIAESTSEGLTRFNRWIVIANPIAIVVACLVLASTATWIERSARRLIWSAVALGSLGLVTAWIPYLANGGAAEVQSKIAFASTSVIITGMFVLLGLSGFKPSDRVR